MKTRKQDLVAQIAAALGQLPPQMSTGSTEPREVFAMVNEVLGLGLDMNLTKPELARAIVESTGRPWSATSESRGGTVTLTGLQQVREAVRFYTGS